MSIFTRFLLVASICMLCFHLNLFADEKEEDKRLEEYFKQCCEKLHLPVAEQMCDTMLQMAKEARNARMELNAAWLKVDYYYFSGDEKHLVSQAETAKQLSKACNNPKAYYFIWGNRLITYYIIQNQMNIALYEVNKMLIEAQQEDYKPGIAECFRAFAVIYLSQAAYELAAEYYQKEIDLYEKEGIENHNLPVEYSSLAQCAIKLGQVDRAREAIEKGKAYADGTEAYQMFVIHKAYVYLYLYLAEYDKALKELQTMEKLCLEDEEKSHQYIDGLHDAQLRYFQQTKQYDKALAIIEQLLQEEPYSSTLYLRNEMTRARGDIYRDMGRFADATREYAKFIEANDTLSNQSMQNAISEFNTILEVELLQNEKGALLMDIQKKQLYVTYLVIAFLVTLCVAGGLFYIRIYRLNGKLKVSEAETRMAKEKAEHASQMKTEFIRSMSHEIRTPLNSIVGFSHVLSDSFSDDAETKEFADIISKNSNNLLRLVNDVLEISALDQSDDLSYTTSEDVNMACQQSVDAVAAEVKEGVELAFAPSCTDLVVRTNPTRIVQILTQLLHNATKFTGQGKVTLSYETTDKQIIYSVTDTGIGIPETEQEHVFERFIKLDCFSQGTGLGLPLCRIIAEKLGGTLVIDKEYKKGCRFLLSLPLVMAE